MTIWPFIRVALACGAILASVVVAPGSRAEDAIAWKAGSPDTFTLADYRQMEKTNRNTLGLILIAMRDTVFYAQKSMGKTVICASPRPIPPAELIQRVDREIAAPSNPAVHRYVDGDQLAFIFVSAMKNAGYCQ